MIISHTHRFIFLHCRKTAGSSLSVLLNQYLGPEDIQIGSWRETIETGGKLNKFAKNLMLREATSHPTHMGKMAAKYCSGNRRRFGAYVNNTIKKQFKNTFGISGAHATSTEISHYFSDYWNDYFKFCFIRNPFEHAISDFYWSQCPRKSVSFEEFLLRKLDLCRPDPEGVVSRPITNWPIYTISEQIAVNFIGKFENINEDLATIGRTIGLSKPLRFGSYKAKGNVRASSGLELYNETCIELVYKIYADEIREFRYTFEDFLHSCAHNYS
jgi:hypothetical protein